MIQNFKSGFVTIIGRPKRGQVNTDEQAYRSEKLPSPQTSLRPQETASRQYTRIWKRDR